MLGECDIVSHNASTSHTTGAVVITASMAEERRCAEWQGAAMLEPTWLRCDDDDGDDVHVVDDVDYAVDTVHYVYSVVGTLGMVGSQFVWAFQGRSVASWSRAVQGRHQYLFCQTS